MNVEPDKIHALISILQSMLTDDSKESSEKEISSNTIAKTRKSQKTKNKRTKSSKTFVNKFDSMPEHNMHKDDTTIDKMLNVLPPVPRNRHFELVNVTCRICGKTEEVSPSLIVESKNRYKCNNCCTSSG